MKTKNNTLERKRGRSPQPEKIQKQVRALLDKGFTYQKTADAVGVKLGVVFRLAEKWRKENGK